MAKQAKTVDEVVRALLGKRAETMSAKERDAAVRAFTDAGKGAVQARTGNLRDAAEAMRRGKQLVADAREGMARASKPGGPAVVADRSWERQRRALRNHGGELKSREGVLGLSVGYREKGGVRTDERAVVVYVEEKKPRDSLSAAALIPERLQEGRQEIATDVVEIGRFVRQQLEGGCSVGPQGQKLQGTLGVFAKRKGAAGMVGLTAMHVTGRKGSFPPGDALTLCAPSGGAVLGLLLDGRSEGIDAASILVSPSAAGSFRITGIGDVRGRRAVSESGDQNAQVRIRGAQSGLLTGIITNPAQDLDLPDGAIHSAILVDEMDSQPGDSGAALVDEGGFVLGILAGRFEGGRRLVAFSPIMPILGELKCDIPTNLL